MGFGPKTSSIESGVQAVRDLIDLLYPERATPTVLDLFGQSARALLTAKAALTFENIDRFWRDPAWRDWIQARWAKPISGPWESLSGQAVDPTDLDPDFGWLIADRLAAAGDDTDDNPN
ncbi:hypothetical protein [Sulfobacillus harzensis]|uniref:Uncharacterized protein n=1 Tax=Sulfobacillus harzensis TaxID=2729629 RepID=A0A7Y0L3Q0_9FIRM|nr:hypothetical protein [Sulfobacillus harzensis]NMP21324.1 hypothetical protein [Sulfobacillus harzensis]